MTSSCQVKHADGLMCALISSHLVARCQGEGQGCVWKWEVLPISVPVKCKALGTVFVQSF